MQYHSASEKSPLAGGDSVTRFVSDVNCQYLSPSAGDVADKDEAGVCDSLQSDTAVAGSTDELTDGSGCVSLTEPSSSQGDSIVTVVSQNHVAADCFIQECSVNAADDLKDGVRNSHSTDNVTHAKELESALKPNSQSGCDGGAGKFSAVLVFGCTY